MCNLHPLHLYPFCFLVRKTSQLPCKDFYCTRAWKPKESPNTNKRSIFHGKYNKLISILQKFPHFYANTAANKIVLLRRIQSKTARTSSLKMVYGSREAGI